MVLPKKRPQINIIEEKVLKDGPRPIPEYDTLGLFLPAPSSFSKPFEMAPYTFIRPHKSLKIYNSYS